MILDSLMVLFKYIGIFSIGYFLLKEFIIFMLIKFLKK